ncbi:unnamed protein product [Parnassius apollo]|uniref:(apollo) hypothetical protein n=1 Tax=Parnassius apollo TaxID=110799 RepID=A0A8S3WUG4_PARAO|nr:unnamed protein product [Parnassius apollo]
MIARALVTALLWSACVAGLAPLTISADDDCALYLTGPGRSSAYDYSLNLLKGNFGYEGQHTCITYEAINQAYLEARNRILVAQPKGDWKPEDFASVGELVLDISIQLARTYGLTYEEIEKGLPLIDTSRTLIREVCPPVFSHVECRAGKYRRLDGLCNNLQHPTWGATMAPFQRLIGPLFSDGINAPRISHSGRDLPLSRVVSRTMHPDEGFHDHAGTVMVIAWGQFMDHDYTLTGTPLDPINRNDPEECCKRPSHLKHPYCNEIRIPEDDYFYRLFGVKCMDFVRGFPSPRPGCRLGSRNPFNTLTGVIDGNTVYGVTDKFSRKLRTGYGGLLRMNPVFKEYGLKDLLPLKLDIPDEGCTRPNKNMYCFEAGEIRVNEQLVLTVMHTLMAREHNRVAEGLAAVNPHWDDETLFQEARRINIAEIQHITYNEFLPILLGKDVMEKFGLVLEKQGYWDGYDPEVNPDVLASFAAAAYRFGHSLLPTAVERWSKAHKFIASKRLSDLIRRPYDLYRAGVLDEYVMGLMNQVAQAMDDSITQEVTNHLFKKVGARFGMDLVSLNMQRGREFGLPGYMEFRKFCGLSGADTFEDLFGSMPNETVRKYQTIFEHPIDVDLWSGGVSERPLPGSMLGPTFACIIATQFSYSRRGDRFWFELPNQPSSFTPEQLSEIRKSRLARVICDNTDIIDTVQLYPMVLPDHELNPRVPCRSGIIPQMDFSKWADPVPFHGPAKQFVTDAVTTTQKIQNTLLKHLDSINAIENSVKYQDSANNNNLEKVICKNITLELDIGNVTNVPVNNVTANSVLTQSKHDNVNMEPYINKTNDEFKTLLDEKNQDTILKYVYKKNDKVNKTQKMNGHFLNKLKRKKRSVTSANINIANENKAHPVLVDYVTSHQTNDRKELLLPIIQTKNNVQRSNLADYNIETLHSDVTNPINLRKNHNLKFNKMNNRNERVKALNLYPDSKKNSSHDKANQDAVINKHYAEGVVNTENKHQLKNEENFDNSLENKKNPDYISNSESVEKDILNTSNSSYESDEIRDRDEKKYFMPLQLKKYSSVENQDNDTSIERNSEQDQDNTEESIELQEDHPKQQDFNHFIRDQKHVINEQLEHPKDINDRTSKSNEEPVKPLEQFKPSLFKSDSDESTNTESNESYAVSDSIEETKHKQKEKQTHINDEEVKPVVELNIESNESSEEIPDELNNSNSKGNDELVSITNNNFYESNDRISSRSDDLDKINVKQQFERIPLDYNHAKKENKDNNYESHKAKIPHNFAETPDNVKSIKGTLDTLSPKEHKYDDKLNIKFHDLTIKLPEIKLPEDILAYAYEEPTNENDLHKDNKKEKTIYDDNDKNSHENKNNEEKYEYEFYKPNTEYDYRNRNGEIKNNDQDEEDLYDKFVRERFGKDSLRKRLEKNQKHKQESGDAKLQNKIKNILKKTEDVQKQAAQSGDPYANYMWTLEYGENL